MRSWSLMGDRLCKVMNNRDQCGTCVCESEHHIITPVVQQIGSNSADDCMKALNTAISGSMH